jgi:hypothetical protein
VSLEGGNPNIVTKLEKRSCCRGASWSDSDEIVFVEGRSGLKAVSTAGGPHRVLSELDLSTGEGSHRTPSHVTGHQTLLFSVFYDDTGKHEVWGLNLENNERKYLLDGLRPRYVETGYILYAKREGFQEGSLWGAPFDPRTMSITGPSKLIQSGVAGREGSAFVVGTSGPIVYLPNQGESVGELLLLDASGTPKLLDEGPVFEQPQFSNDGELIAVGVTESGRTASIRIYEINTGAYSEFAEGMQPLWGIDDASIVYNQFGKGLVRKQIASRSEPEMLVRHNHIIIPNTWVDGGRTLVYNATGPERVGDVYALTLGGETRHIAGDGAALASVSPDERWIAVCTWPAGVVVGSFPDMDRRTVASTTGCSPKWNKDGTQLYIQNLNKVLSVDVASGRSLAFDTPRTIGDLGNLGSRRQYDVAGDGRIVLARHVNRSSKPVVVLTNWGPLLN